MVAQIRECEGGHNGPIRESFSDMRSERYSVSLCCGGCCYDIGLYLYERLRKKNERKMKEKQRLKRRIQAYENFDNLFGCMLEADFRHVFNRMAQEKDIKTKNIKSIIGICNEEECLELNLSLDCYQIDKIRRERKLEK